jgi:hypothetical protein
MIDSHGRPDPFGLGLRASVETADRPAPSAYFTETI